MGNVVTEPFQSRHETVCRLCGVQLIEVVVAPFFVGLAVANDVVNHDQHTVRHANRGLLHSLTAREAKKQC